MAAQERLASLLAATEKLVHPLSEVRRRAVQSLDFKLKHQLLTTEELAKERPALRNLLGCLQFDDNGIAADSAVLMLLARAASAPFAARQLLHLGAEPLLVRLQQTRPPELQSLISAALSAILAAPQLGASAPSTPALPQGQTFGAPPLAGSGTYQHGLPHSTYQNTSSHQGSSALLAPNTVSAPAFTFSPVLSSKHASAARRQGYDEDTTAANAGARHSREPFPASGRPPTSGLGTAWASSCRPEEPPLQRRLAAATSEPAPLGAPGGTGGRSRHWLLAPVALGESDDQDLFELSLRLQYLDDPRVVLPALAQLQGGALTDLPVEAVIGRHNILDHLLLLLTSARSPPEHVALAGQCLLGMLVAAKRALLYGTDARYGSREGGQRESADGLRSGSPERTAEGEVAAAGLLPQPLPSACGVAWAAPMEGDAGGSWAGNSAIDVTHVAYNIALQVFTALKDPQRLFAVAPLLEELTPLLLLGRDGAVAVDGPQDLAKWSQLFKALAQALVANLAIARAESPPIVQGFTRDAGMGPLPPVLSPSASALLTLAARLLSSLPPDLWRNDVVPPALTDTLSAVARDEVLSALLPELRPAVLPVLSVLRPDVPVMLEIAASAEAALAAGEALARGVEALAAGQLAAEAWLQQLQAALPALHLPSQEPLLGAVVQGLALACRSGGDVGPSALEDASGGGAEEEGGGASWAAQAEGLFLALLSHPTASIALACHSLLEQLAQEARAQPGHHLAQLLTRKAVLQQLVVLGLADERTRRQVARILLHLMVDARCQARLRPWAFWVRLYEADPQVGALAAALAAGEQAAAAAAATSLQPQQPGLQGVVEGLPGAWTWHHLRGVVLELYSVEAERRREAAQRLASALRVEAADVASGEPHTADPFRVCLDGGARDDLVVPCASARMARGFRTADVANLLAILTNAQLALELRRSAAEQLLALAADERLREALEEEASLRAVLCIAALRDPATGAPAVSASQAGALAAEGLTPPAPDLLSTLDVQLPVASINLLYVLVGRSPRARAWLAHERSGLPMLASGVLPLTFHSMVTVRRAVARLLAALCFGCEADRWSGWHALERSTLPAVTERHEGASGPGPGQGSTASAGDVVVLPQPFQRRYRLPCRATWLALPAVTRAAREGSILDGKPMLQGLVAEQRELVVLLVHERAALRGAGGDPARLLELMNERPDCLGGLPIAALHTLAVSIRALPQGGAVVRSLAAVGLAASHAECSCAVRELQAACSSRQGVAALATADWQVHLERLLSTAPLSPEDRALWLELLEPVRRLLASGALDKHELLQLARFLRRSALQQLSAPDAAADPPAVPVALAGSTSVPDHSPQTAHLLTTQAVLDTLLTLIRCARVRLTPHQGLRVLAALAPGQLLHTLASGYLGCAAANYGCRAAAVRLLLEVLALLGTAKAAHSLQEVEALEAGLQDALVACLRALLASASANFAGSGPQPPGGAGASGGGHVSAVVAERARERQAGGFRGKGAVRAAMQCLLHLTVLLPAPEWTACWQQLSGSYWLSRLLRGRDNTLRALAAELLARLMQPGAEGTQAMVAQGWPDAAKLMAKAATDRTACYALRTAALRVLCCCMALDTAPGAPGSQPLAAAAEGPAATDPTATGLPRRQLFSSLAALPPAALLLQHRQLWSALPGSLREPSAPPAFTAAALALLLEGLLRDSLGTSRLLLQPGVLDRLVQLLESDPGAGAVGAVGDSGREAPGPQAGAAGAAQAEREAAVCLLSRGPAATWEAAAACAAAGPADLPWAACPAVDLRATARDVLRNPDAPTPDPGQSHNRLAATRCSLLAAQLLTHLLQDPDLTQGQGASPYDDEPLPPLPAHSAAAVAKAALGAVSRFGSGVAAVDAGRGQRLGPAEVECGVRLEAASQTVAAANAALQLLAEAEADQTLLDVDTGLCRDPTRGPLLGTCAELLLAACSPRHLRSALVCLLATLLARKETASALLRGQGADAEHLLPTTAKPVGAGLCAALVSLLSDDALDPSSPASAAFDPSAAPAYTPSHRASRARTSTSSLPTPSTAWAQPTPATQGPPGTARAQPYTASVPAPDAAAPQGLGSAELVIIVALRNLLAYSDGAKAAALHSSFHRVVFNSCAKAAAALAPQASGSHGPAGHGAGGSHTPKKGSATGAGHGAARSVAHSHHAAGGSALHTPAVAGAPRSALASLRRSQALTALSKRSQQQQQPLLRPAAVSPAAGVPESRQASPPRAAVERKAAARRATEQKTVAALSLLKHLAYGSPSARHHLCRDGVMGVLRTLWPAAAANTSGPLLHELLGCLTNLLPACPDARTRVASEGAVAGGGPDAAAGAAAANAACGSPGTLLGSLLAVLFESPRVEAPTWALALGVLQQLSAPEDGAVLLLKSPFPAAASKALLAMANGHPSGAGAGGGAAGGGGAGGGGGRQARDLQRQAALLSVLANLAAWPDGQRAMLRSGAAPGLLDLVVRLVSPAAGDVSGAGPGGGMFAGGGGAGGAAGPAAAQVRVAALGLLRNLCFAAEAKAHLLANPAVLPALVAAAEEAADGPEAAAFAASGLWSLAYLGEKVKAALRRVPSAPQRLVAALSAARFQETRTAAQLEAAQRAAAAAATASSSASDLRPGAYGAADVEGLKERVKWLRLAGEQLAGLVEALQTTAPQGGGPSEGPEAAVRGGAGQAADSRPDWSPQRDQSAVRGLLLA
ncbi:hypothetical protein HYH03_012146 [Edaphochlamys debaryana]|uniref:Rotatin N-terminal domain-containing protein n=1 Tax=Edaphochlamys debaryana TaxID=47281 RepID=A0A835XT79_9CHLO|nr:hypothetical protein HYH03_012146 [Edaphochlamys debaryana]|eukprot:KAG2489314.1 hypothetical protein HYH03_012146 [Edaphochlamys debaryana]